MNRTGFDRTRSVNRESWPALRQYFPRKFPRTSLNVVTMAGAQEVWLSPQPLPKIAGLPDFGWRVRFDHEFKEKCKPFNRPRLHQLRGMFAFIGRYMWLLYRKRREGKKSFIDFMNLVPWKPIYGAPIGGIGCGTIGRGFRGEFCRFQMVPGMYEHEVVQANQFIVCIRKNGQTVYQQVLSPHQPKGNELSAWKWSFEQENAWYHALYPRSWTLYELPGQNVRLICRQVSPVIPHEYKDSSLPVAVFDWTVENLGTEPVQVSIMFTFKNGQGVAADRDGGVWSEPFTHKHEDTQVSGVMMHQKFRDMACTYAISAKHKSTSHVSHCVAFDPKGTGQGLWSDLMQDGRLDSTTESSKATVKGQELASAVCVQCDVMPNSTTESQFCLAWDMPVIHFGSQEQYYYRWYTKFFGRDGNASPSLTSYALHMYPEWETKIEEWQNQVLQSSKLPSWYKSALFNELYFISDGGTVWLDVERKHDSSQHCSDDSVPELVKQYGRFAYLEGHEYRMYNTYDVHHYASFALLMLWPRLQESLQYDIGHAVGVQQDRTVRYCMGGAVGSAKVRNAVPHDLGDPDDEPWIKMNAYQIHPTQEWKDLNTKFILQVYRDYIHTKNKQYLTDMYPKAKAVMEMSLRWDTDDDGVIDNGGFADQTYDAWVMTGASAYCGGIWLAAVKMFCEMASELGHVEDEAKFSQILQRGKDAYQKKLWNGSYYNYDSSKSHHHDSIHSDQLAGHWFLKASGIPDDSVFPKDNVTKTLQTIFEYNVMTFCGGTMGAINGMRPNKTKDTTSIQSEEFWTGVIYSLAATMIQEGLVEMGFQTAYGSYHTCYNRYGLAFQTPEAYFEERQFRSLGYMRPLAIWAIQFAVEKFQPHLLTSHDQVT